MVRTFLSIKISIVNGSIVKAIVERSLSGVSVLSCVCVCVCMCVCVCIYVCVCMYVYVCLCMYVCVCVGYVLGMY